MNSSRRQSHALSLASALTLAGAGAYCLGQQHVVYGVLCLVASGILFKASVSRRRRARVAG